MSTAAGPAAPVTAHDVHDLLTYLAANADVARADGCDDKVRVFHSFMKTVKGLADRAGDLPDTARRPRTL